jgi:hypothetical protein
MPHSPRQLLIGLCQPDSAGRRLTSQMYGSARSRGCASSRSRSPASADAGDLCTLGEYQAAYELDTDNLARSERTLGVDHPSTLAGSANLAMDLRALTRSARPRGSTPTRWPPVLVTPNAVRICVQNSQLQQRSRSIAACADVPLSRSRQFGCVALPDSRLSGLVSARWPICSSRRENQRGGGPFRNKPWCWHPMPASSIFEV